MSSRMAAAAVRSTLAEVAKALGHAHRVELLEQLAQGPRSVEALAERVGISVANTEAPAGCAKRFQHRLSSAVRKRA